MIRHRLLIIYGIMLVSFTIYISLDTFVLASAYQSDAGRPNTSMFADGSVKSLDLEEDTTNEQVKDMSENSQSADNPDEISTDTDTADTAKGEGKSTGTGKSRKHSGRGKTSTKADSSETGDNDETGSATQNTDSQQVTSAEKETGEIDSFTSGDAKISLTKYDYEGTAVYVADVTLSSAEYLKTAFASGTYGKNITQTTSSMASDNSAVLAINGDNYGSQEAGYVIRNGVVYRDDAGKNDVLCIYADGSMEVIDPSKYSAQELVDKGVWQAFSFGPSLIEDGSVAVTQSDEVGKAKASNPRTAIGIISDLHYLFVVSDGRTDSSEGLSLYQLATFMESLGATTAYNLDGGGSSTMVFKGEVINNPTTSGNSIKERKVNDIVYIG
jgi:exopolysaccharide biosynthesis protein